MKITIQDRADGEEDEIIVRCRHLDDRMLKMIYALKEGQEKLTALKVGDLFNWPQKISTILRRWIIRCLPIWRGTFMSVSSSCMS